MPSPRRAFTKSFLFAAILSLLLGIGSYWLINRWLMPHPVVNLFPEFKLGDIGQSILGFICDADARWLLVIKKARDENKKKHPVLIYDLLSDRKLVWESDWDDEGLISSSPIIDGFRSIQKTTDGRLHVVEWNFATRSKRVTTLDIAPSSNQSNVVLKNHGKYLVVLNRWQLWPWRLLAFPGQWPLDALFLQNHPARVYNTSDYGVEAAIWDMDAKKLHASFFLAPPVPSILSISESGLCISADGRWLVIPEAIKRTGSAFWSKLDEPAETTKTYVPSEPRGVRVVDLTTGLTKWLEHSQLEEVRRSQAGAYNISLDDGFVRLQYEVATHNPTIGVEYQPTTTLSFDEYYQTFDLSTGKRATHVFPDYHKLDAPGWGATIRKGPGEWPDWIQTVATKLGIDLNNYPLPSYLTVTFLDTRNGESRFIYKQKMSEERDQEAGSSPSGRAFLITRLTPEGFEITRWQVPFEVYSPWWAWGVGLFCLTMPLVWWLKGSLRSTVVG